MSIHHNPFHSPCIVDQKDLNEAMMMAISEVALRNVDHCAELFKISVRLAKRFALMRLQGTLSFGQFDQILDLATTPSPMWRVVMDAQDVEAMQKAQIPMKRVYLEPYRHIVAKLNEQVILTLLRYTSHIRTAALVSGLGNKDFMDVIVNASCSSLLQSAKNMGRPMIELTINESYLDRIFSPTGGVPLKASVRGLISRVMCSWKDYSALTQALDQEISEVEPEPERKVGRPTAVFLSSGEADTIEQLVMHGVNSKTILAFTRSEINPAQLRKLRMQVDVRIDTFNAEKGPSRFQDSNAAVWGSATRRLIATSILAHQRILVSMGVSTHAAFVEAYEHYSLHYKDADCHLSLARMISAVYLPMRAGFVQLSYCDHCSSMHLLHESYPNAVECPVCSLVKFKKWGKGGSCESGVKVKESEANITKLRGNKFRFPKSRKNAAAGQWFEKKDCATLSAIRSESDPLVGWMHMGQRHAQGMAVEPRFGS